MPTGGFIRLLRLLLDGGIVGVLVVPKKPSRKPRTNVMVLPSPRRLRLGLDRWGCVAAWVARCKEWRLPRPNQQSKQKGRSRKTEVPQHREARAQVLIALASSEFFNHVCDTGDSKVKSSHTFALHARSHASIPSSIDSLDSLPRSFLLCPLTNPPVSRIVESPLKIYSFGRTRRLFKFYYIVDGRDTRSSRPPINRGGQALEFEPTETSRRT